MTANETQVGGAHYRTPFQHWDLVVELKLDYFTGQITKYVTRHRKKGARTDLEKALHFASKLRELSSLDLVKPQHLFPTVDTMDRYFAANDLPPDDCSVIGAACRWSGTKDLAWLCIAIKNLIQDTYPDKDSL